MEYLNALLQGNIELLLFAGFAMLIVEIPIFCASAAINYFINKQATKNAIKEALAEIHSAEQQRQKMIREDMIK